jgi:hypothetical protein
MSEPAFPYDYNIESVWEITPSSSNQKALEGAASRNRAAGTEREDCSRRKHLGGDPGFIAIPQIRAAAGRRIFFSPHIHILIPAVAFSQGDCQLRHLRNQEYLIPEKALA